MDFSLLAAAILVVFGCSDANVSGREFETQFTATQTSEMSNSAIVPNAAAVEKLWRCREISTGQKVLCQATTTATTTAVCSAAGARAKG